jgi:hypothetical protein
MKIALLFLTHRPSHVLAKFLDLAEANKDYETFLHHDFSQSDLTPEILNHPSLSILESYCKTQWADVSLVEAAIALLRFSFEHSSEFEWFVLLSGSCYPIRPLTHILDFLESTNYDGFIENTQLNQTGNWLHKAYFKHIFTLSLTHIPFISRKGKLYWRDIRKKRKHTPFSQDFQLHFGSQWWALRRKLVSDLILHPKLEELLEFARINHVHAPDEWIIQSVIGNLKGLNLKAESLHYINWDNSQDWHPNVLTMDNLNSVVNSGKLFARKFNDSESTVLLQHLDQRIHKPYVK